MMSQRCDLQIQPDQQKVGSNETVNALDSYKYNYKQHKIIIRGNYYSTKSRFKRNSQCINRTAINIIINNYTGE